MTNNLYAGAYNPHVISAGSPTAILAIVPALLGFEPGHSFVVIGTEQPRGRVHVTLRFDLPDPCDPVLAAEMAGDAVGVLSAQRITTAVAVGYGSDEAVSAVVSALREDAPRAQITLTEVLRVEGKRYWSYLCGEPACSPAEGTPFDIAGHPAARSMAIAGRQVLASRDELRATLAAADGDAAEAMRRALSRAQEQIAECVARVTRAGHRIAGRRLTATLGRLIVAEAIGRYRAGKTIGTELAAWLTVVLCEGRVRDDAWARMLPEHRDAHRRLWTDLTRLARPGYVAAPASLLAFVAWQSGDGALANLALDRALADNPRYSMARLLRQALDSGAPPFLARLPMTPEEVAASYDAIDTEDAGDTGGEDAAQTVPAGEARRM